MSRDFAPENTGDGDHLANLRAHMRLADVLVAPWTDPALRAQIDPDLSEIVGPPTPIRPLRNQGYP